MLSEEQIEQAREIDLVQLVERDLGPGKRAGRWVMFVCPFHEDHEPSLGVTNGGSDRGPLWRCFGCGRKGDAIAWAKEYHRLGFSDAVEFLSGALVIGSLEVASDKPFREPSEPPGELWQQRARKLVERAEGYLWGSAGSEEAFDWPALDPETGEVRTDRMPALDWLLARGLNVDTLKFWRIGLIPKDWQDQGASWGFTGNIWIPQGVLIPCIVGDRIWYLKIRKPKIKPKYGQVKGSKPAIYLVQTLEWHSQAVLCEGELDTLLLWQTAGDLAGAATLGSAAAGLDLSTWGLYMLGIREWFTAYDLDPSGQEGAKKLAWLRSSRRLVIPQLREGEKDLTDFFKHGGDLREWLSGELARS